MKGRRWVKLHLRRRREMGEEMKKTAVQFVPSGPASNRRGNRAIKVGGGAREQPQGGCQIVHKQHEGSNPADPGGQKPQRK